MSWTIKQVSKLTGIPTDSLRYYDKLGIVSPKRGVNGYRTYDEKDFTVLQYVVVMKYAQFSLAEIKEVIGLLGHEPSEECNRISRNILLKKIELLSERAVNYQRISESLMSLLPLIDSSQTYHMRESEIDIFVKKLCDKIKDDDDSL